MRKGEGVEKGNKKGSWGGKISQEQRKGKSMSWRRGREGMHLGTPDLGAEKDLPYLAG